MLVPFTRTPFRFETTPWGFDQVFSDLLGDGSPAVQRPALDLTQTDDALTLQVELPGVREEDVDLSIHEDLLVLTAQRHAEKRDESEVDGHKVLRTERHHGRLERRLRLPKPVDAERVQARLRDGVLTVQLPFAAHATPRKIPVLPADAG